MKFNRYIIIVLVFWLCITNAVGQEMTVDYRYAPDWHLSTPALPDDSYKTLVGPQGQLLYDYGGQKFYAYALGKGFKTVIHMMADENQRFESQKLHSARIPITVTRSSVYGMEIMQEVYSSAKLLQTGNTLIHPFTDNREDILLTSVKNNTSAKRTIAPLIVVDSEYGVEVEGQKVTIRGKEHFCFSLPVVRVRKNLADFKTVVELTPVTLNAGEEYQIVGIYDNGLKSDLVTAILADPQKVLSQLPNICEKVITFWKKDSDIPYGRIEVPDREIQNLVDASIRGIWQAREIVDGNISFQVGPTCYRGLWIVDGAFLAETAALLGRGEEARKGIEYTLSFQNEDGGFAKLNKTFWKENGIVLWTCVRHAMLTQDKEWLRSVWPILCKTVDYIKVLRQRSYKNETSLDDGLIPPGYIDGGLNGGMNQPEYSNTVWNLAGLKSMIGAAWWLGFKTDAKKWQSEYDNFFSTFQKAAHRDMDMDDFGNRYLNNMMDPKQRSLPQRALWAFCQSVYPGQIFETNDSIAVGTMNMLHTTLQEGMVMGTGWIIEGIWNYFSSFYGHACLWMGEPERASASLYAFANHASPLYLWREEHNPRDLQRDFVGDMPHNWGSAEFIRLVVHLLQLDRGNDLHLLEGIPREWLKAGMRTALQGIATPFGLLSFTLEVSQDGKIAEMNIQPLSDKTCENLIVHTRGWGMMNGKDIIKLKPNCPNHLKIEIKN